ncbi:MAG: PD-(D/E)XK nuclease family protein, partial [Bacteroidales bacterium]|nr:PD-(D/E)XK nuclease family protein [Bacteroidales bacterium]
DSDLDHDSDNVSVKVNVNVPKEVSVNVKVSVNTNKVRDKFMESLTNALKDLLNPNSEFNQTPNDKNCGFCPYNKICDRTK